MQGLGKCVIAASKDRLRASYDELASCQLSASQNFQITLLLLPISVSKSKGVSSKNIMKHSQEYLKADTAFNSQLICMTRSNIKTGHLPAIKTSYLNKEITGF